MKAKLILIALLLIAFSSFSQKKHFAEVYIVNGIEAYILNEPIRPYEVIYGKGQSINWGSYLTAGIINKGVSAKVGSFIKGMIKQGLKDKKSFDAVIYTSGKNITAVKFTDQPTPETKLKAKVHRLNGIPTYVMCEPYKDFRAKKTKGGGIKWKSLVTVGLINNSIEQDLMRFARKYKKMYTKKKIDALYYTSGKKCDAIVFE